LIVEKGHGIVHGRFKLFLAILVLGGAVFSVFAPPASAIALGFDCASLTFLASSAFVWAHGTPEEMRKTASRDDGGRALLLAMSTIVVAVVLVVLVMIAGGAQNGGIANLLLIVTTQLLAWTFANVVWAFHYAHLYYDVGLKRQDTGGLSFPGDGQPEFSDFCYFSFVLGMTFQVSDVEITAAHFRKVAMIHGMVAFFYNLGVLALTVNLVAGAL
jgi:uncharacterized membrane protein